MPYLKMLWQQGTPPTPTPTIQSWDFWTSKATRTLVMECGSKKMYTVTPKIVYYAIYESVLPDYSGYPGQCWFRFLFMSPDLDAVSAEDNYHNYYSGFANQYITDNNGIKWYYQSSSNYLNYESYNPDYRLEVDCDIEGGVTEAHAAQTLLDRIYAVPFREDYQIGQTYTLYATDQKKTLRKAYSTYLHRNINQYASSIKYRALSDNADTIINTLINTVQSYSAPGSVIDISVFEYGVYISHGTTSSWGYDATQIDNASLESQSTSNNYKLYEFSIPDPSWPGSVYPDWETFAEIDSSGQITYDTWNGYDTQIDSIDFYVGVEASYYVTITLTNIGIDL